MPRIAEHIQIEYENLSQIARAAGLSQDRFGEIVQAVEDEARSSLAWGSIDDRITEIRRRIIG